MLCVLSTQSFYRAHIILFICTQKINDSGFGYFNFYIAYVSK